MFKWWLFTIFINIHKFIIQIQFVCLNYFKNTLSNIVYCTITGSLKTIDSWQISRKLKIVSKYPPFWGFSRNFSEKHPISRFRETGFKIPLFSWNLELTLDHKCPWRVATGMKTWLISFCCHDFTLLVEILTMYENAADVQYLSNKTKFLL